MLSVVWCPAISRVSKILAGSFLRSTDIEAHHKALLDVEQMCEPFIDQQLALQIAHHLVHAYFDCSCFPDEKVSGSTWGSMIDHCLVQ